MKFHSKIVDETLPNIDEINDQIRQLPFKGEYGPDGVLYPDVSKLPDDIEAEFHKAIEIASGFHIRPVVTFARLSVSGVEPPHWAHNDAAIASYTALLYLDTNKHGGTALVTHKETQINSGPLSEKMVEIWRRDTNDLSKWDVDFVCPMVYNRLLLLDSELFHASLPVGGFGESAKNGRIVMICFFNKDK